MVNFILRIIIALEMVLFDCSFVFVLFIAFTKQYFEF